MIITRNYTWLPLDSEIALRLESVLESWVGTPYSCGQRAKSMGVDCVQLVGGVMDELYRSPTPTIIPRMKTDSGVHSIRAGFQTVLALRHGWPTKTIRDNSIEPGDVLVTRASLNNGGPKRLGHALIAGVRPGIIYHATGKPGVCRSTLHGGPEIVRIYRLLDKKKWI